MEFTYTHSHTHTLQVKWVPTEDRGPNGAEGKARFDPPLSISLIVTLYRVSDKPTSLLWHMTSVATAVMFELLYKRNYSSVMTNSVHTFMVILYYIKLLTS